ncbi:armadillo-type protein, partial [Fennellomyces sp. T-0311]
MMDALFEHGQFSVSLLDNVVRSFYGGDASAAQPILTAFQQHPDSWQVADQILERSQVVQAKFIALQVLEKFISTRWRHLPQDQRIAIRNYVGSVIVSQSSSEASLQADKAYLSKLNMVLVEIVKKEWPEEWPSFVNEMVASARVSLSLCENNMMVLRLLSEEVFEASEEAQADWKTRKLKEQLTSELDPIIELCREVLLRRPSKRLVKATLEALSHFLKWIPPNMIFDMDLMSILCNQLSSNVEDRSYRSLALKCCTEVTGRQDIPDQFLPGLSALGESVVLAIHALIPTKEGIRGMYKDGRQRGHELIDDYTLFITTALSAHGEAIAVSKPQLLTQIHQDLLALSAIDDQELWKTCAEYWVHFTSRKCEYMEPVSSTNLLHELRKAAVKRISNPDNALVIGEEDGGIISREFVEKSENPEVYRITKNLLRNLTTLNISDTQATLQASLKESQTGSFMVSWRNLNQACWAIGAISGVMDESQELQFINQCLAILNKVCINEKEGSAEPCILFIASKYPHALHKLQGFFGAAIRLTAKYLHDKEASIQKFAAHALVEICQGIQQNTGSQDQQGSTMFLQNLLVHLPSLVSELDLQQTCEIYRAIGYVFSILPKQYQQQYMQKFMDEPNKALRIALYQNQQAEADTLKTLSDILRINIAVCDTVNAGYESQLKYIHGDMLTAYHAASEIGPIPLLNNLRERVKDQINVLLTTYIKNKPALSVDDQNLIDPLLREFLMSPPSKHDVSDTLCVLVEKHLNHRIEHAVHDGYMRSLLETAYQIFERIYGEIGQDFTSYYDKRPGFFRLVQGLVTYAFRELLTLLSQDKFSVLVRSILWGIQHPAHEISNQALEICTVFLKNIYELEDEDEQSVLYSLYYMQILDVILHTITD